MKNLEHIDFQRSLVLGWRRDGIDPVFEIGACLTTSHPDYTRPKIGETVRWVHGELVFEFPTDIQGLKNNEQVSPSTDPDCSQDYGEIESLVKNTRGDWFISGDFGDVHVGGASLQIHFDNKNVENALKALHPNSDHRGVEQRRIRS